MVLLNLVNRLLGDDQTDGKASQEDPIKRYAKGKTNAIDKTTAVECEFNESLSKNEPECQFRSAAKLLICRQYEACQRAYQKLMELYPERRSVCEMQLGTVYYYKGEYKKAIELFMRARVHGADEIQMENSIWQICVEKCDANIDNDLKHELLGQYLTLFPNGQNIFRARQMMDGLI